MSLPTYWLRSLNPRLAQHVNLGVTLPLKMARPRKPIDPARRSRLMAEARKHFARSGYQQTSLTRLLADAEFSRSSFYYFFQTKAALFDAAFIDGLDQIASQVNLPHLDDLTTETYWPVLHTTLGQLAHASTNADLVSTGALVHLPDAPASPAVTSFVTTAQAWCLDLIRVGRTLQAIDDSLPIELHVELVWSVATTMDRWMTSREKTPEDAAALTGIVLERVLGRIT